VTIVSSWTIDARGFAWPAGVEPHAVVKRGPKPRAELAAAKAELRRRAIEQAAERRRRTGEAKR